VFTKTITELLDLFGAVHLGLKLPTPNKSISYLTMELTRNNSNS